MYEVQRRRAVNDRNDTHNERSRTRYRIVIKNNNKAWLRAYRIGGGGEGHSNKWFRPDE